MIIKSYEKKSIIYFLIGLSIISETIFIFFLWSKKEYNYIKLQGIMVKDDLVLVVISKEDRKKLYQNSKIYLQDKFKKYKVIEDRGVLIKREKDYYELLLEIETNKKLKANDVVNLTIRNEKYQLIKIFKYIWEGG